MQLEKAQQLKEERKANIMRVAQNDIVGGTSTGGFSNGNHSYVSKGCFNTDRVLQAARGTGAWTSVVKGTALAEARASTGCPWVEGTMALRQAGWKM